MKICKASGYNVENAIHEDVFYCLLGDPNDFEGAIYWDTRRKQVDYIDFYMDRRCSNDLIKTLIAKQRIQLDIFRNINLPMLETIKQQVLPNLSR